MAETSKNTLHLRGEEILKSNKLNPSLKALIEQFEQDVPEFKIEDVEVADNKLIYSPQFNVLDQKIDCTFEFIAKNDGIYGRGKFEGFFGYVDDRSVYGRAFLYNLKHKNFKYSITNFEYKPTLKNVGVSLRDFTSKENASLLLNKALAEFRNEQNIIDYRALFDKVYR